VDSFRVTENQTSENRNKRAQPEVEKHALMVLKRLLDCLDAGPDQRRTLAGSQRIFFLVLGLNSGPHTC
jgi:hypothetical protein